MSEFSSPRQQRPASDAVASTAFKSLSNEQSAGREIHILPPQTECLAETQPQRSCHRNQRSEAMVLGRGQKKTRLLRHQRLNLACVVPRRLHELRNVLCDESPPASLIQRRAEYRPCIPDVPRTRALRLVLSEPPLNVMRGEPRQRYLAETR
jgi:hypothetical protein